MWKKVLGRLLLGLCCGLAPAAAQQPGLADLNAPIAAPAVQARIIHWTPAARFLVSPVPEPITYTMLGVGLFLVVVAARRQRRFLRG